MKQATGISIARAIVFVLALGIGGSAAAQAGSYPARPMKIIVPYPPGGQGDTLGRIVGKKMSEMLGQQVLVENHPGAGGTLGVDLAAKAPADGYTLGLGDSGTLGVAPSLYAKLPYDPLRDLSPVSSVAMITAALAVNPNVPANTVRELIELARAKKGSLTYGAGYGSMSNLAMELLKSMAGVSITHISYKGFAPQLVAVLSGEISMTIGDYSAMAPHVKAGKLRVLAVTSNRRSPAAPQYPTLAEAGIEGYAADFWFGLLVPKATPADVVSKLNSTVVGALKAPDVSQIFDNRGYIATGGTPEEFTATIRAEINKYARVVKEANIKLQ
ncbi:MAG: tripartite tricarboxylate transporter substrate binding protein [Betaproteobacteria bacterium]|nr:tripartite tricarboxylate transporter substrate binding protein [Betaproteobacteria bacterium]MBI2959474.1 tripartite tricarboxylate transporter substrate binding protein [Betaproteobacteria bacterium]